MNRPLSAARGVSPWAWALAITVHVLFVMVLVFGVAWQHQVVAPVEAELWSELPAAATVTKPPVPQPAPAPAPPPPPAPPAPAQPVTPPTPSAADIALKKKKEKELEAQKQAQKRERAVAEQIRQQRAEAVKEQQQEDARRAQQEAQRKKAAQLAKAAQEAKAALIDRYKLAIINKIRGNTEVPEGVPSGTILEVDLTVLPTGEVMMPVKIVKSSGNTLYDQAVVRGIMRSQPLPLPTEPELRREFRVTHLQLKHEK